MKRVFLGLLVVAAVAAAHAQAVSVVMPPAGAAAPVAPSTAKGRTLAPFVAAYEVFRGGEAFGDASLQLARIDGGLWRVNLGIRGTRGLIGLAGLNFQQSTLFDVNGARYRPLSQSTVRKAFFGDRRSTGVYDWSKHLAQWQGDVKASRRGAVALQDGDMSGLLINLAVLRDVVSGEREPHEVDDVSYSAMRVTRAKGGDEETILWVVEGVPMPIRILQRENGQDVTDLRLKEYKGA
jgi:hypothetical protein